MKRHPCSWLANAIQSISDFFRPTRSVKLPQHPSTNEKESTTMSLEKAVEANTAAVMALTAAILANGTATTAKPAAPAPAATTGALDYERDIKPVALEVAKKKGREALLAIFKEFKVDNALGLKPAQWAEFKKKCDAALA